MQVHKISRLPLFGAETLVSVPGITGFDRNLLRPNLSTDELVRIVFVGPKFCRQAIESTGAFKTSTHSSSLVIGDVRSKKPNSQIPSQARNAVDLVDVVALMTRQPAGQSGPLDVTTVQGTGWVMAENPEWSGVISWWHPSKRIFIPTIGEIDYGPEPGWVFEALPTIEGEWCLNGMKILFRWF